MPSTTDIAELIEHHDDEDWVAQASCGDLGLEQLDMFFVQAGRSLSKEAADMCRNCPVRRECLEFALRRDIGGGYFGGVSPSKRRAELKALERTQGQAQAEATLALAAVLID